ncbi:MAG: cupin domain-containing protein [Bradymonadaceae bacterium]
MTDMAKGQEELIERLGLEPHPEGGFFREMWRSSQVLTAEALPPQYGGWRNAGTSILYLLPSGQQSAWHRVRSDELWLFQGGDPLELAMCIDREESETSVIIGPEEGHLYQSAVPGGWWQMARPVEGKSGYSLVACVVVPGFDFRDFEFESEAT